MKAKNYAIFSVLLSTLLMCFVDGIISPPYLYKSIIKIVLFLLIPLGYFLLYKDKAAYLKKLFIPKKKDFLLALLLGIGVFVVIMIAYFLLGDYNYLNEKCENIYPSWLVHMCANFGINTIGFILFGII